MSKKSERIIDIYGSPSKYGVLTDESVKFIEDAYDEALSMGHQVVSSGHLLLAATQNSGTREPLLSVGAKFEDIRTIVALDQRRRHRKKVVLGISLDIESGDSLMSPRGTNRHSPDHLNIASRSRVGSSTLFEIRPEDILLNMIHINSFAAKILERQGIVLYYLEREILAQSYRGDPEESSVNAGTTLLNWGVNGWLKNMSYSVEVLQKIVDQNSKV